MLAEGRGTMVTTTPAQVSHIHRDANHSWSGSGAGCAFSRTGCAKLAFRFAGQHVLAVEVRQHHWQLLVRHREQARKQAVLDNAVRSCWDRRCWSLGGVPCKTLLMPYPAP